MKTIYTVIFGEYEELKEPSFITPGWNYICYTDQPFTSSIWQIINIPTWADKRMHSRELKINFDRYISAHESIYIDGSFRINCNLNKWWQDKFVAPATFVKHPRRDCVFEEIDRCLLHKRCDPDKLLAQREAYRMQVPKHNGIIQSGLMMRQQTPEVIDLMRRWWYELQKYSTRDQVAMAYVARKMKLHAITWNYAKANEFLFTTHFNRRKNETI